MYRAVLDTCALVPSLQRDFLLQLATEDAYAPLWGSGILFELDYVLAGLYDKRGITDSAARRQHLFDQLKQAFPGAEVHAPKDREYSYGLNDPDDYHVAHAAIIGKADAIVTDDRRAGFSSATVLVEASVETVYPHQFAANTVSAHPHAGVRALQAMSNRRTNPPQTPEQILDLLVTRHQMTEVADILRPQLAKMRAGPDAR
ncbi:PIN domain-containing protein [Mycobacteroides abscessus]|uniref:PIN domain-containing protein n=1 Tax=Mycobacteroides abscessus TaxID=36809 RepID=UPI0007F97C2A|nr:PIN domain-containing protein [Mycobacteroides abscessus]ANO13118.1 PIN domain-containing protein [Mycobacteroides abscessus]MDM2050255.1 PIN domain-containing protein [Mycobacteroides abscessus]MDM2055174.1 PIN domain-containing protein [Mycobacteroides abscessus]MDM2059849.1 PIN domain-containing protein [Mycobacteroides abscessus]MDM2064002.1 PIN domain-containing protein [Mycobacteroides abscessus]